MTMRGVMHDAPEVVIGGGFYGCMLALALRRSGREVLLVEAQETLMAGASAVNQARVHGGYHYPRNFATAYRSQRNLRPFIEDFRPAIVDQFTHVYAIARQGSKVSSRRFAEMFTAMGAALKPAPAALAGLFAPPLIEQVFEVYEPAFDYTVIRQLLMAQLAAAGVKVRLGAPVSRVLSIDQAWTVLFAGRPTVQASRVYVATYSALNHLLHASGLPTLALKHEATEMALVELPPDLQQLAVTVMDGPFFSLLPYPSRGLHTLSHVRYTPRASWLDQAAPIDGAAELARVRTTSAARYMLRDAQRYLPLLAQAQVRDSLFANKTVLARNEADDGRPIFYHPDWAGQPGLTLLLGSKMDNIYDMLAAAGVTAPAAAQQVA